MDFYFDDYSNFSAQHALPSGRTPAPTNYPYSFNSHEPCSYCSDSYHSASNCPSWGQFYNFPYEQMNTNFSSPGFDSIFTIRTGATILISRGKLKPWEIVLPNFRNCIILNICNSTTNLPILHPIIIQFHFHNQLWKTLSKSSCSSQARLLVK